jgi:hypothetical protein
MLDGLSVIGGYQCKRAALLRSQQWTALDFIVTQQCNQAVIEFYSNDTVDYRLLFQSGVRLGVLGSRSSGLVNCSLMMEYTPKCRCGVQEDR